MMEVRYAGGVGVWMEGWEVGMEGLELGMEGLEVEMGEGRWICLNGGNDGGVGGRDG